jgi:L-asparaginase
MQHSTPLVVVLGTGGTIAGTASSPTEHTDYAAAQIGIAALVGAVPALTHLTTECEQVAQIDSKDMGHAVWQALAQRVAHHMSRAEVAGVVVTHGTDTLEETAYFLHRVLAPTKPVVLTGAMRPATSSQADGPRNLADALAVAREPCRFGRSGVVAVMAGTVHGARQVRKAHPTRPDAFDSGEAGPLGVVEAGGVRWFSDHADAAAFDAMPPLHAALTRDVAQWPRVEIVVSHAGANGAVVRALCADGAKGLVVAATGNGTVHHDLQVALLQAQAQGVSVLRSLRYGDGLQSALAAKRRTV